RLGFTPEGDGLLIAQGEDLRLWPAWPLDRIDAERAAERDQDSRKPSEPALPRAEKTFSLPTASLAALGGDYRLSPAVPLHVAVAPRGLRLSYEGGASTLQPVSPTEFVSPDSGARIHFDGTIVGRANRLILVQDGRRFECPRAAPAPGRPRP